MRSCARAIRACCRLDVSGCVCECAHTVEDELNQVVDAAIESIELVARTGQEWLPIGIVLYRGPFVPASGPTSTMQRGPLGLVILDSGKLPTGVTYDDVERIAFDAVAALATAGHLQAAVLCKRVVDTTGERTAGMLWIEHAEGPTLRMFQPYDRDAHTGAITISDAPT